MLFSLKYVWNGTFLPTLKGNNSFVVHNFKIKVGNGLCRLGPQWEHLM
jgi:hypothetical protein